MEFKKRYIYDIHSITSPVNEDKTIDVVIERETGFSSFEDALRYNNIHFLEYKIVPVNNHFNVMGLTNGEWIKVKVCKTYKGCKKYIEKI